MRIEEQHLHCWRHSEHFCDVSLDCLDHIHVVDVEQVVHDLRQQLCLHFVPLSQQLYAYKTADHSEAGFCLPQPSWGSGSLFHAA